MKHKKTDNTRLEAANPLTKKGKTWLKKEIRKFKGSKAAKSLRRKLENQRFEEPADLDAYWNWVENYGGVETPQANPDFSNDSGKSVDGDYETY